MNKFKKLLVAVAMAAMVFTGCTGGTNAKVETISKAGTYTGEYNEIVVTAADTVLENVTAEKITIAKEVGDGDVTLKNVNVANLEVYGGGENSIHLYGCDIDNVNSHKEDGIVRIVVEEASSVQEFDSTNTIIVIRTEAGEVLSVIANENTTVITEENTNVQEIVVKDATTKVEVYGKVDNVEVTSPDAEVVVESTALVGEVKVAPEAEGAKVEVKGVVGNVKVEAANTELTVAEEAVVAQVVLTETAAETTLAVEGKVTTLATQAAVEVAGTGTVEAVEAETEDLVTAADGATATEEATVTVKPVEVDKVPVAEPTTEPETQATPAPEAKPTQAPQTPAAHTHTFSVVASSVDATCTAGGTVTFKCAGCDETTTSATTAYGHNYKETVTAATCTKEGAKVTKCERCGDTKTETIAKLAHTETTLTSKAATCTATGLTEGKQCTVCMTITVKQEEIPMVAHTYDAGKVGSAATCTTTGKQIYTCTVCGSGSKTEEIPALGHTEGTGVVKTAATCTDKGVMAYNCTVCNTELRTEEIPATGHQINDTKKCTVCNTELATLLEGSDTIVLTENITIPEDFDNNSSGSSWLEIKGNVILDGNGKTITATKAFTANTHVIGVNEGVNPTIKNLTVIGGGTNGRACINVYKAAATLENLTLKGGKAGVVVNSSDVTAKNITTADNAWYGINVDGKYSKATLTIDTITKNGETVAICSQNDNTVTVSDSNFVVVELGGGVKYYVKDTATADVLTVATANGVRYGSLQAAVNAGGEVTLLKDITLDGTGIDINKSVTINMAGYKITAINGTYADGAIDVNGNINVTIKGNGTIDATDFNFVLNVIGANSTVTIEDGSYNGSEGGCLYIASTATNSVINIKNGTYTAKPYNGVSYVINQKDSTATAASYVITGGSFENTNPAECNNENPSMNYVPEGFVSVKEGNSYVVYAEANAPATCVAVANRVGYATLQEAMAADGDVTLVNNVDITSTVVSTKTKSLNLNGKTITNTQNIYGTGVDGRDWSLISVRGGTLTINGEGNLICTDGFAVDTRESGAKLILNGGNYSAVEHVAYVRDGSLVINGGKYQLTGFTNTLTEDRYRYTINAYDSYINALQNKNSAIEIIGGEFYKFNPNDNQAENPKVDFAPNKTFVADGEWYK